MSVAQKIRQAKLLKKNNRPQEALTILEICLESTTTTPDLYYQIASLYDFMGREKEAIPFYEKALTHGLIKERAEAFLGLGSTYRCLGQYRKSLTVFDRAIKEFPQHRVLRVFRALTTYNLGHATQAVQILLDQLLATTNDISIKSYDRALRLYKDNLDQVWE